MRVVIFTGLNTGDAEYRNLGDVAMLQVAVSRLLEIWPDSSVAVLTDSPEELARHCPGAQALPRAGCVCMAGDRVLFGRLFDRSPHWLAAGLRSLHRVLEDYTPRLFELIIRLKLTVLDPHRRGRQLRLFLHALNRCDLFVVSGAGGFADSCREWNLLALDTINLALRRGIPVVMLGQGMGPLTDSTVLARCRSVLPKVRLITLRGGRGGEDLLKLLNVAPDKILTTGDETVESAYAARNNLQGIALGINLRVAFYTGITDDLIDEIRPVLQRFSRENSAPLLPVPIAFHQWARDHESIRKLLSGINDSSDGGLALDSSQKIFRQIGTCRVVVTGAYHAATFALAQGIPVVCLSTSAYYAAKFEGLQDLFGVGCSIVRIQEPDLQKRLSDAIEDAWKTADDVRASLLESARNQIELSRGAYRRVQECCKRVEDSSPSRLRKSVAV